MSKVTSKPGTMLYPVPTVMVSCGDGEKDDIITIGWSGIVNSEPPMTYVSVRKSRFSHHLIQAKKEFVINLVNEDLVKAADFCGVRSGENLDKWKEMNLHREKASIVDVPMIAESPVSLECVVKEVSELGSHDMFLAEIVAVHVDEKYVGENGAFEFERMKLTAYNHGKYYALKKEPLGFFGFSVMKPKTAKRKRREEAGKRRQEFRKRTKAKGKPRKK